MTEPNSYVPEDSPNLDFVYNNQTGLKPTYWPIFWSEYEIPEQANQLYNDYDSDYITYSGDLWKSLMVSKQKDGRYKNFTLRAYSGDSFNFYLSAGSLVDGVETYYSGPVTTSGNYSVLTSYSGQSTAEANAVSFTAPGDNTTVYTFPQVNTINFVKLYHQATTVSGEYRLYQFLPRTLIQVDDLEADVISAVTVRVQDSIVIGPDMIGDKTLLGRKIVDGTLSGILLTDGTITGSKIQANTISGVLITAGTITGDKIAAATISGALITAGTITSDKINVTNLSAVNANTGNLSVNGTLTVTSGVITAGLTRIDSNGIDIDSTGLVGLNDSLRIIGSGATGAITGMSWYNRHYSATVPVATMGLDAVNVLSISMPRVGTGNVIQFDFDNTNGGQVKILDGGLDIVKGDLFVYNSTGTSIVSHIKNTGEGKFTSVISPVFLTQTTGSAGSPTYVTTDPDSGMYGPADGIIAFSTNAVEALRINNNQQLLLSDIGVSFLNDLDTGIYRPTTNTLTLVASGVASLTATHTGVDVGGFLGVNTAGLVTSLSLDVGDLAGGSTLSTFHYDQTGSTVSLFRSSDNTTSNFLDFYKSRGSRSSNAAVTAGDLVFLIRGYAYQSNGAYDEVTRITGDTGTNTDAGVLRFSTAPTGGAITERVTITSDGNVGIATNSPATSARLEIASTTGALLVPRMTTTQRNALTAVNGMIIYNTTTATLQGYQNSGWTNL